MNKVVLIGRLIKNPELRFTNSGTAVANFALAVNRAYKQEGQPQADFINCVAWAKSAEFINSYFVKGQQVGIVGRIQTRTYEDNDGRKVYITEVVVEETYFADSKRERGEEREEDPQKAYAYDEGGLPF